MNFGEYLKKITGMDASKIQDAENNAQKVEKEADYTEASLFTA